MRALLLAAAVLVASPAFAKSAKRPPAAGQFCKKAKIGTTVQSKAGDTLECKAVGKGAKWTKK